MFKELRNEAKIRFEMKPRSPFCIRSGDSCGIDPTLPDMQCIKTSKDGAMTVFIPGSSIKGVLRSRCEKILELLGYNVCEVTDKASNCEKSQKKSIRAANNDGKKIYESICPACKMFGTLSLGSRIKFADSYPKGKVLTGIRNGVGINRITGASQRGALYDFEVVEDGTFDVEISLSNFELYQLKVLIWSIQDIGAGYVTFGASSTRGNGLMETCGEILEIRDYRSSKPSGIRGYEDGDQSGNLELKEEGYYYACSIEGLDNMLKELEKVNVGKNISAG